MRADGRHCGLPPSKGIGDDRRSRRVPARPCWRHRRRPGLLRVGFQAGVMLWFPALPGPQPPIWTRAAGRGSTLVPAGQDRGQAKPGTCLASKPPTCRSRPRARFARPHPACGQPQRRLSPPPSQAQCQASPQSYLVLMLLEGEACHRACQPFPPKPLLRLAIGFPPGGSPKVVRDPPEGKTVLGGSVV
jgi:hypothetical protein